MYLHGKNGQPIAAGFFDNGFGFCGELSSAAALEERTFLGSLNGGFFALVLYPPGLPCAGGEVKNNLPHLAV
jgi:hypothetical protein